MGLLNKSEEFLHNGKKRFANNGDRIRSLLPMVDLDATVKAKVLEVLRFLVDTKYTEEAQIERASESLSRTLELLWATI